MLKNLVVVFSLLMMCSCTPSKQFISLNQNNRVTKLNKEIRNKKVKIVRFEGTSIKSNDVQVTADSIFYSNPEKNSLAISNVRSIVVSPKLSASTVIALSLFGLGTYSIISAENSPSIAGAIGSIYKGIFNIGVGIGVFIFGNNIESEIYYFNKETY